MSFTSDEVNYLIYRYLQESGFIHSAYVFGVESHISQTNINGTLVPPAALLTVIQKGLQFTEAEISVADDGTERLGDPLSLIDAVMPEVIEARRLALKKPSSADTDPTTNKTDTNGPSAEFKQTDSETKSDKQPSLLKNELDASSQRNTPPVNGTTSPFVEKTNGSYAKSIETGRPKTPNDVTNLYPTAEPIKDELVKEEPMDIDPQLRQHIQNLQQQFSAAHTSMEIPANRVTVLSGHDSEVFICAWNPVQDLLASGSGDSTARIWNLCDNTPQYKQALLLRHCIPKGDSSVPSNKDVTSLDWDVSLKKFYCLLIFFYLLIKIMKLIF